MKRIGILLCAAALSLSACAPAASGAVPPVSETPVSDASDAVYEALRILPVSEIQADMQADVQARLDDVQRLRESYGGSEIRYINLAGTVAEESLGEELGTLTLENAVYDAGGVNLLPDGAKAVIEWNIAENRTHLSFTDAAGTALLGLERTPDGKTQYSEGTLSVTKEECGALAYYALALIQNRYAAKGALAPLTVQPVEAGKSGDAMTDDEAIETVRAVLGAADRLMKWERDSGYVLMDLTHPEEGVAVESGLMSLLYLPSLSFVDEDAYCAAYDAVFLRQTPDGSSAPAVFVWDGRVWVCTTQGGIGGSYGVKPEKIEIVSKEPDRIAADVWETYNDSGVSAIPLVRSRYELTVQNGNWVVDRASSVQDAESYAAAAEAWDTWFSTHYAQFTAAEVSNADLGALWGMLGVGAGSWKGTEQGAWNENATLASPGFAFSVQDGRYCVALYSTLGSGATTYIADRALTDGTGMYAVTIGSFIGEMMAEKTYSEAYRPQLWIEMGEEGDGLVRIAGQNMDQLDGWLYEYEFFYGES